jgi:tight adherence protein B
MIGPVGVFLGAAPGLIARSLNKRSARKRQRALNDALAPALQRIVDQLHVGRTISAAIEASVEHASDPLDGIFRRVISDNNVGIPIDVSLTTIAAEERNRHLDIIASALALHAQHGGSLTDILVAVLESIEEEDRLRRDLLTLTADARLSANVLLAMPIGALVITSLLSPGYATPLIASSAGRFMSVSGAVLGMLGVLWLRHLAQPETA